VEDLLKAGKTVRALSYREYQIDPKQIEVRWDD